MHYNGPVERRPGAELALTAMCLSLVCGPTLMKICRMQMLRNWILVDDDWELGSSARRCDASY